MRPITAIALALSIFATGCASVQPQPVTPAWLEMKEGYAQACIDGGGCVPMTRQELQQLVNVVHQRTLQMCARNGA